MGEKTTRRWCWCWWRKEGRRSEERGGGAVSRCHCTTPPPPLLLLRSPGGGTDRCGAGGLSVGPHTDSGQGGEGWPSRYRKNGDPMMPELCRNHNRPMEGPLRWSWGNLVHSMRSRYRRESSGEAEMEARLSRVALRHWRLSDVAWDMKGAHRISRSNVLGQTAVQSNQRPLFGVIFYGSSFNFITAGPDH